jgi:hypothetical protein
MSRSARVLAAGLVLLGATALIFGGGQILMCFLPVFARMPSIQCEQAMGVLGIGWGLPVFALTIAVATFLVAPVPAGRRWPVLVGGILGGAIGGAAFLVLRPLTMEGFNSSGGWISIPRPLDTYALATAVIFGALLGTIGVRLVPEARRVRLARS